MTDALLDIRDLRVEFLLHDVPIPAVRGVSFDIMPADTVALVGESGSGKSVIAQSIMGILPDIARITEGSVLFNDPARGGEVTNIANLAPQSSRMRAIRGGRISMIFQEPMVSLSPLHTVGDQVSEALHLHRKVSRSEGVELTREMLRLVGFPEPARALKNYPFELSGGLRQRAMIAMALICRPALLIADEPTTALDVTIQAQILRQLKELQSELGMAVLLITHDLGVVANLADEVVVVYHGEVMERGTVEDVFNRAGHPYLKSLLKAVPHFDMKPEERLVSVREVKQEGSELLESKHKAPWTPEAKAAGPHLSLNGISKQFRIRKTSVMGHGEEETVQAIDDVSFQVQPGECLGLVGESGCGKTTLGRVITRALRPDAGTIAYNDRGKLIDVLALGGEAEFEFRRKIQFVFQDPFSSLNPRMTVFDIVREPLIIHRIGDDASQAETVKELLRVVGLDPRFLNRYPHSFSGGQRQRIGIARALALRPDFLICDEPVSALDVSIQAQILNLLKDLQSGLDLTYLFISHNLAVVDYVADRIAVMCRGRLVEVAPREILFRQPIHPYTRSLLAAVPYPDLERPLDFEALMEGRGSQPDAWEPPFTVRDENPTALISLSNSHFVRAAQGTTAAELQ